MTSFKFSVVTSVAVTISASWTRSWPSTWFLFVMAVSAATPGPTSTHIFASKSPFFTSIMNYLFSKIEKLILINVDLNRFKMLAAADVTLNHRVLIYTERTRSIFYKKFKKWVFDPLFHHFRFHFWPALLECQHQFELNAQICTTYWLHSSFLAWAYVPSM